MPLNPGIPVITEYLTCTWEAVKWPCLLFFHIGHIPHKLVSQRALAEEHSLLLRRFFLYRLINFFWNSVKVRAHSKSASADLTSKLNQCDYKYLSLLCTCSSIRIDGNLNFSCTKWGFKNQYFESSSFITNCRSTQILLKYNVLIH